MKFKIATMVFIAAACHSCMNSRNGAEIKPRLYQEQFRPQYHFSPAKMWTNDPNGLVYLNGEYHLFYQYYPDSTVWGPMHWGHAISTDLLHWQHLPIALYPDSLGYIFSGSAVIDTASTSGLGEPGKPAMVAIFTYHNPVLEKAGKNNYQYQGLAYSLDKGRSWTKYKNNPVLPNPGLRDFRDPNVSWNIAAGKWILTLAAGDHLCFYSSVNLKEWKLESEFGKGIGAHGGVWECPSLFEMSVSNEPGTKKWVLLVSINPGGPDGGSATQYFTGTFDGHSFKNDDNTIRWIDNGPDNYAGILWSNTGDRKIFLGWMNNWNYANLVPTSPWRGQMTIPRELSLFKSAEGYMVRSLPVKEISTLLKTILNKGNITPDDKGIEFKFKGDELTRSKTDLNFHTDENAELTLEISNGIGQKIIFGVNPGKGELFADRTNGGIRSFSQSFAASVHKTDIPKITGNINLTILLDNCSAELFLQDGLYNMTELIFPEKAYNSFKVSFRHGEGTIDSLKINSVESVWKIKNE
ncbi:MAG: glycoside hydrolase family 32 protein [Bacteroidales bacterium]|jgi:fructan beta-fructosidase